MVPKELLNFAAREYGTDGNTMRFVAAGREETRQFYGFAKQGKEYILRIVRCGAEQLSQTWAEMEWLCYLAGKKMSVSVPLRSNSGDLVILADMDGEPYVLSAYSMAQGRPWNPNDPELWNERIFHAWGKTMGDIHRATKEYSAGEGGWKRPEFTSIILDTVREFPSVHRAAEEVLREIETLPKDGDSYGLIHYDLHPGNFMIDGDRINVFDFADCAYAWYALDIGCALTVGLWLGHTNDEGVDFTNDMIKHFLEGYRSANELSDYWLSKIPLFMRLCQIAGFSSTNSCEKPEDAQQREQIHNIENHILLTGCDIDPSLFAHP